MKLHRRCFGSSLALLFAVAGVAGFAIRPAVAAQVAASIEFDAAPRSAGLPDDMQALPGASLKFLSIKAIDGFKVDAALWQPDNNPAGPHQAAHAEGSLVQDITYEVVPDPHPAGPAGHVFTDNTQALVEAVSAWLAKQHL